MISIRVDLDLGPWRAWTDALVSREIPFAVAVALTRTARDARQTLVAELPQHFQIRTPYTEKRLRFKAASKRSWIAEVGHLGDYMRLQAEGGRKVPRKTAVGVPTKKLRQQSPSGTTTRNLWPSRLTRQGAFQLPTRSGSMALYRRLSDGSLERLYVLSSTVDVQARWPFTQTVERVARERWPVNFQEAMTAGVARARRRAGQR
jgi:hypothetical protein